MAGSTDIARLMLQVDASTEIARKNMRDLARAVEKDGGDIEKALQRVEASHQKMGQQLQKAGGGQFRGGMQQLSFQIGDVTQQMALGVSGSRIFIQQSGQVIQALQLMAAEQTGFLRFLAGPWGVALLTAGTVLVTFAGKLFETRDEVGKLVAEMRKQADQAAKNDQANKIWEASLDGIIAKTRELREEQRKQILTDRELQREQLGKLQEKKKTADEDAARLQRELAAAQRTLQTLQQQAAAGGTGSRGAVDSSTLEAAREKVARLTAELNKAKTAAASAGSAIANMEILAARSDAAALSDPIEGIRRRYEDLRRAAENAALGNEKLRKSLKATLADLNKREAAEIKAANEKKKATDAGATQFQSVVDGGTIRGQFGEKRGTRLHEGIDIAVPVGTPVKAPAAGTIIEAGNLPGYGNVIFIDHGRGTITRLAHLSAFKAAKGDLVDAGDVVGLSGGAKGAPGSGNSQGPHVHQEVRVGGKAVDPRKGSFNTDPALAGRSAIKAAKAAADRIVDQDDRLAGQLLKLDQELLQAQMELVSGVQAQADFAKKQVDVEQARFEQAIAADVNDGRLREEQGKLLIEKSQAVALQKKANIDARAFIDKLEEQNRTLAQASDFQVDALRFQEEIARTAREKRDIELQILAALYAQREADLKLAKAKATSAHHWEEVARIEAQLAELPRQRARDEYRARQDNMGPLERWADGVPQDAAEMQEFFEGLKVQGIEGAIDSLMALTEGFESFRDTAINAIRQVLAELLRLQLMKFALNLMGMGAAPADFSSFVPTGMEGIYGGLMGAATGIVGTIGGRGGGDSNILSINGRPQLRVERGETLAVLPKGSTAALPSPLQESPPRAKGGDTYQISVTAPNSGDPVRDRRTALQQAGMIRTQIARVSEKGFG